MRLFEKILSGNVYAVAILVIFSAVNILWGRRHMGTLSVISAAMLIAADLYAGTISMILNMVGYLLLLAVIISQSIQFWGWDKKDKR